MKKSADKNVMNSFIILTIILYFLQKCIFMYYGALGLPVILVGFLLYYLQKRRKWARTCYCIWSILIIIVCLVISGITFAGHIYWDTLTQKLLILSFVSFTMGILHLVELIWLWKSATAQQYFFTNN